MSTIGDPFDEIRQADGIRLAMCPDCDQPHLLLLDEEGDIFAQVVLSDEVGLELIEALQTMFGRSAVKN